jgi:hypothetical protein
LEYDCTTRVGTTYDVATRVGTSHVSTTRVGTSHVSTTRVGPIRVSTTRVGILMTSDFRLIETACIHCLYKPVLGTELGKSSSAAFNSQTTLRKLVFTDCWDLANPNRRAYTARYQVPITARSETLAVGGYLRNIPIYTLGNDTVMSCEVIAELQ